MEELTSSIEHFSLQLMNAMVSNDQSQNRFFSPFSLATALGMVLAGAKGKTAQEITTALHLKGADCHKSFHHLITTLPESKNDLILYTANGLFIDLAFRISKAFQSSAKDCYRASAQNVDFRKAPAPVVNIINEWIEKNTNGKMKSVISADSVDDSTRMILVNTIYFKNSWDEVFYKSNTSKKPFYNTPTEKVLVDMMYQQEVHGYTKNKDLKFQAIEIKYSYCTTSMVIILPDDIDGLDEMLKQLTADVCKDLLKNMTFEAEILLSLPAFKLETEMVMNNVLSSLGIRDAFTPKADFSEMSDQENLYISECIHKAFIGVDEQGTEAAAVTTIKCVPCCLVTYSTDPIPFTVDRPFLFFIKCRSSNLTLFSGLVRKL